MTAYQRIDPVLSRLKRMKKNVLNSVRLHNDDMNMEGRRYRCAMMTLTYADIDDYDPRDISTCLKKVRKYLKTRGIPFRYVWVMELQKRGAPHYHVILWLPWQKMAGKKGKSMKLPFPDKCGWWNKGNSNLKWMRNPWYIAKYASKTAKAGHSPSVAWTFPKGARISGQGGLSETGKQERRWWSAPLWVRKLSTPNKNIVPVSGGWASRQTGQFYKSPYKLVMKGGSIFCCCEPGAKFDGFPKPPPKLLVLDIHRQIIGPPLTLTS